MKKLVALGLFAGVAAAVIALLRRNRPSLSPEEREEQRAEKRRQMSERLRAGMEAMPEDFPPRVMFDNVATTRENSERILELLEGEHTGATEPVASIAT